jgi:hypothetical protein
MKNYCDDLTVPLLIAALLNDVQRIFAATEEGGEMRREVGFLEGLTWVKQAIGERAVIIMGNGLKGNNDATVTAMNRGAAEALHELMMAINAKMTAVASTRSVREDAETQ